MSFDSLLVFLDMDLLLAIGIIIFAAIISGYTGFGGALFQVPLMVMLFGPVEAVAVTRLVSMFGRAQLYPSSARTANWSEVFPLVIAIVVITPFASSVLFIADPDLIRRGIGGLVIALTIFMLSGWQYRGPRRWPASLSFGAACGALAGVAGIGGPPMVVYFMAGPDEARVKRANIIITVALVTLVVLITFIVKGGVGISTLVRAAILFPASIAGTWIGNWIFKIAPQSYFRKFALGVLFATGLAALLL
jgi:uncharacterized membrane protein YfcA